MPSQKCKPYDVGLSFAGANRSVVEELDRELKNKGVRTFLDSDHTPHLAGEVLVELLPDIYRNKCNLYVPIVSKDFVNSFWAKCEKRAALEYALTQDGYVLPIRLDDTIVPGLLNCIGYLSVSLGVNKIADTIASKLLIQRTETIFDSRGSLSLEGYSIMPVQLAVTIKDIQSPLGQAHLAIACEHAIRAIQSEMQSRSNPDVNDSSTMIGSQLFPSRAGQRLIKTLSSIWPSYQIQFTFIDDELNILSHLDLRQRENLFDSALPLGVKTHIRNLVSDYGSQDNPYFAWTDNMSSSHFGNLATSKNARLQQRSIGTIFPRFIGGSSSSSSRRSGDGQTINPQIASFSGSRPRLTSVLVFGEAHLLD